MTNAGEQLLNYLLKPPTFLLVEDNESDQFMFTSCLNAFEHNLVLADSGRKAIEIVKQQTFDAIFLDLKLGDISGVNVLKVAEVIQPSTPIIVITGYPDCKEAERIMQSGTLHVIEKPATLPILRSLFKDFKIRVTEIQHKL